MAATVVANRGAEYAGQRQVGQPPQDAGPGQADRLEMSEGGLALAI